MVKENMKENMENTIEVTYQRRLHKSYMCMKRQIEASEGYELRMLENRQIPCLLKLDTTITEGQRNYLYDISGKQQIEDYLSGKRIDCEMLWKFLFSMQELCNVLPDYLLRETGICLKREYIYVNLEDKRLYFTYLPFWEKSLSESFEYCMEEILRKIDHQDQAATELGYQVYQMCLTENASIQNILESVIREKKKPVRENRKEPVIEDIPEEDREEDIPEKRNLQDWMRDKWKASLKDHPNIFWLLDKLERNLKKEQDFPDEKKKNSMKKKGKKRKEQKGRDRTEVFQKEKAIKKIFRKTQKEPESFCQSEYCGAIPEEKENREEKVPLHPTEILALHSQSLQGKLVYQGIHGCKDFLVEGEEFLLGKNRQQAEGVIEAEGVSRLHARISRKGEQFYLEDLNSTNGTWLNEVPLEYHQKKELNKNDRIRFGAEEYLFF